MDALELNAEVRKTTGRGVKHLRKEGWVPAVLYGRDLDSMSLQIDSRVLTKVLRVAGTHQLIALKVGNSRPRMTLARDIQRDVIKHSYLHVDFYAVKMDEKVNAQIPIHLAGEAPAVKEHGGILTQGLDELEIECLPSDLISSVEVDISSLVDINDTIYVSDLTVPDTITILAEPESMVAKVEPPRKVEELEALEEEGLEVPVSAEPEVLTESREEADEDEE